MVVLHLFMIPLVLCGSLLQPQYCPSIADYVLGSLGQLCLLRLDQTFPIGLIQVPPTIGMCIILPNRPQALPALVVSIFGLVPQPPLFWVPFGDVLVSLE